MSKLRPYRLNHKELLVYRYLIGKVAEALKQTKDKEIPAEFVSFDDINKNIEKDISRKELLAICRDLKDTVYCGKPSGYDFKLKTWIIVLGISDKVELDGKIFDGVFVNGGPNQTEIAYNDVTENNCRNIFR